MNYGLDGTVSIDFYSAFPSYRCIPRLGWAGKLLAGYFDMDNIRLDIAAFDGQARNLYIVYCFVIYYFGNIFTFHLSNDHLQLARSVVGILWRAEY